MSPPFSGDPTYVPLRAVNIFALRKLALCAGLEALPNLDWHKTTRHINIALDTYARWAAKVRSSSTSRATQEWCAALQDQCSVLLKGLGEALPNAPRDVRAGKDAISHLGIAWHLQEAAENDEWLRQLRVTIADNIPGIKKADSVEAKSTIDVVVEVEEAVGMSLAFLASNLRITWLLANRAANGWEQHVRRGGRITDSPRMMLFLNLWHIYVDSFGEGETGLSTEQTEARDAVPTGKILFWHQVLLTFVGRRAIHSPAFAANRAPLVELGKWARGDRQGKRLGLRDGLAWQIREAKRLGGSIRPMLDD